MEDLEYAGINFGVICFLYIFSVFLILKLNTMRFIQMVKENSQNASNSYFEQILEAYVFWPIETKKNQKLICIEKVIYIFVIFTNQEVAQSLFEQQQNIDDDLQKNLYRYLIIPLICFGGLLCQKGFYFIFYDFYENCFFNWLEKKHPQTIKFAFSDPRSRSMFFFGYVITNLIVVLVVFNEFKDENLFGRCIGQAALSSLVQLLLELIFVFLIVYFIQKNSKLFTILFQQMSHNRFYNTPHP